MTATTVRSRGLVAGEQHHHVCKIWKNLFVLCVLSSRKCKARAKCVLTCSAVLAGSVLSMRRANRAVCVSRWVQRLPFHTNAEGLPTSSFHIASFFLVLLQSCKPHKRSVCGSNGRTYRNHCELHRDACLTGLKIQVAHDGHCQGRSIRARRLSLHANSLIWRPVSKLTVSLKFGN